MKKFVFFLIVFIVCAIALIPSDCIKSKGFHRSGKKHFESCDYAKAAEDFSSAIKINPDNARYYIDYGMSLIALGEYDKAIEQFDFVYKDRNIKAVLENNKRALRGKGIAYYMMGKGKKAINYFNQALEIDLLTELDMDIIEYKDNSLIIEKEYEEAKLEEKRISLKNEIVAYEKAGKYHEAKEKMQEYIENNPEDQEALQELIFIESRLNR